MKKVLCILIVLCGVLLTGCRSACDDFTKLKEKTETLSMQADVLQAEIYRMMAAQVDAGIIDPNSAIIVDLLEFSDDVDMVQVEVKELLDAGETILCFEIEDDEEK